MKNYILGVILALGILATPTLTMAAGLTTAQSTSLIAVVQAAPGIPASAFVNLITAFSNITVNQATSLITVVQAAPGIAPSAFVNLLISFTADTSTTQSAIPATNQTVMSTATTTSATSSKTAQTPTIFSLSLSPSSGPVGTKVTVHGSGFDSYSAVSFNGSAISTADIIYGAVGISFTVPSTLINCASGNFPVCIGVPYTYTVIPATYYVQIVNTSDDTKSTAVPFTVTQTQTTTISTTSSTKCNGNLLCSVSA